MAHGFSSAVSRLLRSLHRTSKHSSSDEDTSCATSSSSSSSTSTSMSSSSSTTTSSLALLSACAGVSLPKTATLPSGFTRHVRHLVEYVTLLVKARSSKRSSSSSSSTRRHAAVTKALDRLSNSLRGRDCNDGRAVPLNAAVELLLTAWECVLQCLDVTRTSSPRAAIDRWSTCSSTCSTSAGDDTTRLERAARMLLALLMKQRELDVLLMALGRGDCNLHQRGDATRKRSIHENNNCTVSFTRDELRVSMRLSRRGSVSGKRAAPVPMPVPVVPLPVLPSLPRQLPARRDVASTSDASLCQLAKKYLDLHQTTLRFLQNANVHFSADTAMDDNSSDGALLMQLLALSYVRVPAVRETMLAAFQQSLRSNHGRRRRLQTRLRRSSSSTAVDTSRSQNASLLEDRGNVALFRWTQNLHSKCHASVAPLHRETQWTRECQQLTMAMRGDAKFQRVLLAHLIDHALTLRCGGHDGDIDWKCLPGAAILKDVVLTMTETVFQSQLRAVELSLLEKEAATTEDSSSLKASADLDGRQSFSLSTAGDWTVGVFFKQTMRMLASNTSLLYDWLLTILHNTNYVASYNVTLCLRYLSQMMDQFPAYFANDSATSATQTLLRQVFTKLLKSEHFEILRNTELFLMKHFAGLSVALRESLIEVFASEFKRLFLHWNRDVRFCYYHMLLYLTYPGNRLVLGAKSDELLMGAVAAQLFEIPGLIRHSSHVAAKWDAFDQPLCELITHVNRVTKNARSPTRSAVAPAMGQQRPRTQPTRTTMTTTRASMTLRPKPASRDRASLTSRPSYGRMSYSAQPTSSSSSAASSSYRSSLSNAMPKCASMSALPVAALAIAPPPPVPAWIQPLPLTTMQRSIQEYRRHVETYFNAACQISVHDAVPTPTLHAAAKA